MRINQDFSVTEKLNEFIRNYDWQQGYQEVVQNNLPTLPDGRIDFDACPGKASFWLTVSAAFESEVAQIYERIANIVPSTNDIEMCTLDALHSIAELLGVEDLKTYDVNYPLEIKELLDIFSITKSKLISDPSVLNSVARTNLLSETNANDADAMDGYLTGWVNLSGGMWDVSQGYDAQSYHVSGLWDTDQYNTILSARVSGTFTYTDDEAYLQYIEDQISGTLEYYVNLDRLIDDMYNSIYTTYQYTPTTILDTPADSSDIDVLKTTLGIPLSFFVREETDKIIRGDIRYQSYSPAEQQLIDAELENRKTLEKYGDQPNTYRRYKYEKERKIREYIRFIENVNLLATGVTVTELNSQYDEIDGTNIRFFDYVNGNPVSGEMIENTTHFLRNQCINASYQRENIRSMVKKHQLIGTEQIFSTLISEYLFREFSDPSTRRLYTFPELSAIAPTIGTVNIGNVSNISGNVYSNISVVEYTDTTEYLNLSATGDAENSDLNERFWEDSGTILTSEHSTAEVSSFYCNLGLDDMSTDELNEFLAAVYDMGALSATQDQLSGFIETARDFLLVEAAGASGEVYDDPTYFVLESLERLALESESIVSSGNLYSDDFLLMLAKYFGDPSGTLPWANYKNTIHPSIAHIPYLYNLQRVIRLNLALDDIYSFYPRLFSELSGSLPGMIDENGNVIDLWRKDNETFSIYRDNYQFSSNFDEEGEEDIRIDYDGPFYFAALSAYLQDPEDFRTNQLCTWYGHLPTLSDGEITKLRWQLENHETSIRSLSGKKIYQFDIDKYGNQYTLFKDSNEFDEQGELWMKYKDHPISFPVVDLNTEKNTQIDIEAAYPSSPSFKDNSEECYDFGVINLNNTQILWMYCADGNADGNRTGRLLFTDIRFSPSIKNKFIGYRLLGNSSNFNLIDRDETFIGVSRILGDNGPTMMFITLQSLDPHPTKTDQYIASFIFRAYDETKGWRLRYHYANATYDQFSHTDNHNQWKLSTFEDLMTITYESTLPLPTDGTVSGLFQGSGGSGYYDPRYNTYKYGYHNGFVTFDFPLATNTTFPQTCVPQHFAGFNDLTYQSVQAFQGWVGGAVDGVNIPSGSLHTYSLDSDNDANIQFLGLSDPVTSGRFDVGPIPMLCYNSNDEYFGLYIGNALPTWSTANYTWESSSSTNFPSGWVERQLASAQLQAWNDTIILYKEFQTPGETFVFGTVDEDSVFYNATITYYGPGCQKFRVDLSEIDVDVVGGAYVGPYWIYTSHYGTITAETSAFITVSFVDPADYLKYSLDEEVGIARESDGGGSVLISNNVPASSRYEYSISGIFTTLSSEYAIISAGYPQLYAETDHEFVVGDKVTLYSMEWTEAIVTSDDDDEEETPEVDPICQYDS